MSQLIPFDFEDQLVRVVMIESEPWFVAADLCRVLGIKNVSDALARLDEDEKTVASADVLGMTLGSNEGQRGGARMFSLVSEPGTYRLIFQSRKPAAQRLMRFLAHEVLPQLRRTGRFEMPGRSEPLGSAFGAVPLAEITAKLDMVRETRHIAGPAAALRQWHVLGLPPIECEADDLARGDPLMRFLREACEVTGEDVFVPVAELWAAHCRWSEAAGEPLWPQHMFARRLAILSKSYRDPVTRKRFEKAKSSLSGYRGLRLRQR